MQGHGLKTATIDKQVNAICIDLWLYIICKISFKWPNKKFFHL